MKKFMTRLLYCMAFISITLIALIGGNTGILLYIFFGALVITGLISVIEFTIIQSSQMLNREKYNDK